MKGQVRPQYAYYIQYIRPRRCAAAAHNALAQMGTRGATAPSSNALPTPPSHQQAPSAAGGRPAAPIVSTPVAAAMDETSIDRRVVPVLLLLLRACRRTHPPTRSTTNLSTPTKRFSLATAATDLEPSRDGIGERDWPRRAFVMEAETFVPPSRPPSPFETTRATASAVAGS